VDLKNWAGRTVQDVLNLRFREGLGAFFTQDKLLTAVDIAGLSAAAYVIYRAIRGDRLALDTSGVREHGALAAEALGRALDETAPADARRAARGEVTSAVGRMLGEFVPKSLLQAAGTAAVAALVTDIVIRTYRSFGALTAGRREYPLYHHFVLKRGGRAELVDFLTHRDMRASRRKSWACSRSSTATWRA
jgi:hypothetical protein